MILLDLSQIAVANLMMSPGLKRGDVDSNLVKHMILNSIRSYNKKFKHEYGNIVICCDDYKGYWRKDIFPEYKAKRKEKRKKAKFDYGEVFDTLNELKAELAAYFPYRVIQVDHAEGDDVIAILAKHSEELVLVVGSDKDYAQLHKYPHVFQYSPGKKDMVTFDNPDYELHKLIIKGDDSDGIPNIKSDSDTFITEKRQSPIKETELTEWFGKDPKTFCNTMKMYDHYKRNKKLIDFDEIPDSIVQQTLREYQSQNSVRDSMKMMDYFAKNKMKHLMRDIGDF